jgi:histidine ammonia-lyase
MGANAATKCYKVMQNVERVLAIELFNAAQALEFRRPLKSSAFIENFVGEYRKVVNFVSDDEIMYTHIHNSVKFIQDYSL